MGADRSEIVGQCYRCPIVVCLFVELVGAELFLKSLAPTVHWPLSRCRMLVCMIFHEIATIRDVHSYSAEQIDCRINVIWIDENAYIIAYTTISSCMSLIL